MRRNVSRRRCRGRSHDHQHDDLPYPTCGPLRPGGPDPLGRLADLTYRHRLATVLAWLAALGIAVVLAGAFGGEFKADYSAPGSDSSAAQQLLEDEFPAQSPATPSTSSSGRAGRRPTRPSAPTVQGAARRPGGRSRTSSASMTRTRPRGSISPDGRTLVAHARLDVVNPPDMPVADSERMLELADGRVPARTLQVALGGQTVQQAEQGEIGSEGLGIAAAALILLVTFGSVVAAGLPIIVAVAGLAVSSTLTTVADLASSTRPTGPPRSPR